MKQITKNPATYSAKFNELQEDISFKFEGEEVECKATICTPFYIEYYDPDEDEYYKVYKCSSFWDTEITMIPYPPIFEDGYLEARYNDLK